MDKLYAIKIKQSDGTYGNEIPINVLAQNVDWDASHTLVDILGEVDTTTSIQDQIINLVNTKATQASVNNLQTRFNNIIAAVTQDAEVQDARVGVDATVYNTLKGRLDAEYIDLKSHLNRLYNPIKWETGKCIIGGHIVTSESYSLSEYFVVAPGVEIYCVTGLNTDTLNLALFDKNKKIIKTYTNADGTLLNPPYGARYEFNITVPDNLSSDPVYFAFSARNVWLDESIFEYKRIIPDLCYKIFDLENATEGVFDPETLKGSTVTTGKLIVYENGSMATAASYSCTDYIPLVLVKGKNILINGVFSGISGCAFYDEDREYISGIGGNNVSDYGGINQLAIQTISAKPPTNASYIRITGNE